MFWTEDAGATWSDITPPGVTLTDVDGVTILADGHVWAAQGSYEPSATEAIGRITVFRRAPAGAWSSSTIRDVPFVSGFGPASLSFINPTTGWLLVDTGSHGGFNYADLFGTTDGGATWAKLGAPASGTLEFLSPSAGYIAGGQLGPNLYTTHNGGATWSQVKLPPPADRPLDAVTVLGVPTTVGGSSVVAAAWIDPTGDPDGFGTYDTTDNGSGWRPVEQPPAPAGSYLWAALPGGGTETILGYGRAPEAVARSTDGGKQFSGFAPTSGLPLAPLSLSAGGADRLWAVVQVEGCRQVKADCFQTSGLFRSDDGGATWRQLTLP